MTDRQSFCRCPETTLALIHRVAQRDVLLTDAVYEIEFDIASHAPPRAYMRIENQVFGYIVLLRGLKVESRSV